jgi:hypothetical protein
MEPMCVLAYGRIVELREQLPSSRCALILGRMFEILLLAPCSLGAWMTI